MILPADPQASARKHRQEILAALERVVDRGPYILGPEVEAFEREFADYLGLGQAIGVANGTDALEIALRAVGVGPGDEVIVPSFTVTATVTALERAGARALFADIDPRTFTLSPDSVEALLAGQSSDRLKAIVPVHLYGHPADLDRLGELARRQGLKLVEDCAQAHGARWRGKRVGTVGQASAFSFYPTKNLGALGDGGGVCTSDRAVADRARLLRQYGWRTRYLSEIAGLNSRLDELQAAILRVRLPHLDAENAHRARLAAIYFERLGDTSLVLPWPVAAAEPVYHQFVVRVPRRAELLSHLESHGVKAGVLYPVPVHRQPAYAAWVKPAQELRESERAAEEVVCLPLHPGLTEEDAGRVADAVLSWPGLASR